MNIISKLLIALMYLFSFDLLLGTCLLWKASVSQVRWTKAVNFSG